MGATFLMGSLKAKTFEKARKEIRGLQDVAASEFGYDPYNGRINNLNHFAEVSREFMGPDELEKRMEDHYKGDGVIARVRVAEDTATIKRWSLELKKIAWYTPANETPREYKTRQRNIVKLREKINKARQTRLEKSKKTVLMYAGWVSV